MAPDKFESTWLTIRTPTQSPKCLALGGSGSKQPNGDCGDSQENGRSLMSRGCAAPTEDIHPPPARASKKPCTQPNARPGLDPRRDAAKSQPIKVKFPSRREVPSNGKLCQGQRGLSHHRDAKPKTVQTLPVGISSVISLFISDCGIL